MRSLVLKKIPRKRGSSITSSLQRTN
jgi:hypothetical protein